MYNVSVMYHSYVPVYGYITYMYAVRRSPAENSLV